MCSNSPGIKLEPALGTEEDKMEHLSSYAHVVHTTAKQVISRRRKNENVFKMTKDEKCTCKACKNTFFHCQICKFVGFLLPSSLWSLKLPKGLAKLGNIVAETLLRMQMFPNLAARETCDAETNFAARKQKMFLPWSQKHFCFPDTNFASETYVSQFSHPGKHSKKHCFRNNVS